MSESEPRDKSSGRAVRVEPMANQIIVPSPQRLNNRAGNLNLLREMQQPMWKSLFANIKDALFPEKLPPLRLTSRPVAVRDIWGHTNSRKAATGSRLVHGVMIGALIALSVLGARTASVVQEKEHVTLIAPVLSDYKPVMTPQVEHKALSGGGGGGENAKIFESKGHLPQTAPVQFTPPTVEIRNMAPKLAVEATIVAPPNVKLPDNPNLPNVGNPMSANVTGPLSNGTGSGGGIGSGNTGGIGSGSGPGHGPGQAGGFGGGVYKIAELGVTAPVPKVTPEPEFSDEALNPKHPAIHPPSPLFLPST